MTFKGKIIFLVSLIIILLSVYAGSFFLNPQRRNSKSASYSWIDASCAGRINRISVATPWSEFELLLKNGLWYILAEGREYPARRMRVEDFIAIFTRTSHWPIRSSAGSSHERFALDVSSASRAVFYDGNDPLLDLLFGSDESAGTGIYLRSFADSEVRSGDYGIKTFLFSYIESWFNLRLVPGSEFGLVSLADVQRVSVFKDGEHQVFTRSARSWTVSGIDVKNPDISRIESYINEILNTEGSAFFEVPSAEPVSLSGARILIELGSGSVINIRFSPEDEYGNSIARPDSSEYYYLIPAWAFSRLFRDAQSFEMF